MPSAVIWLGRRARGARDGEALPKVGAGTGGGKTEAPPGRSHPFNGYSVLLFVASIVCALGADKLLNDDKWRLISAEDIQLCFTERPSPVEIKDSSSRRPEGHGREEGEKKKHVSIRSCVPVGTLVKETDTQTRFAIAPCTRSEFARGICSGFMG